MTSLSVGKLAPVNGRWINKAAHSVYLDLEATLEPISVKWLTAWQTGKVGFNEAYRGFREERNAVIDEMVKLRAAFFMFDLVVDAPQKPV